MHQPLNDAPILKPLAEFPKFRVMMHPPGEFYFRHEKAAYSLDVFRSAGRFAFTSATLILK